MPTWFAPILAVATFVGGLLAAMFGRKAKKPEPENPENGDTMLAQRVAELEFVVHAHSEKWKRAETDRIEGLATAERLFEKIDKTQEDVSEIKGMLKSRRHLP